MEGNVTRQFLAKFLVKLITQENANEIIKKIHSKELLK